MNTYDVIMTPSDDGSWVLKSEVDAEIRRLKRALWLARAYRGRDNSILLPSKFMRNVWDRVMNNFIFRLDRFSRRWKG